MVFRINQHFFGVYLLIISLVNFVVLLVPIINPYFVHLPWFWLVFSMLLNFCLLILSVWMIVSSKKY